MSNGHAQELAESSTNNSWSLQTVPSPTDSNLLAVSCASETACVAVGNTGVRATAEGVRGKPAAEAWNGITWSTQQTPTSSIDVDTSLNGVSCTSPTTCIAVGSSSSKNQTLHPFSERLS
jgi:hypothetical protein